jgi:hypothetical protein
MEPVVRGDVVELSGALSRVPVFGPEFSDFDRHFNFPAQNWQKNPMIGRRPVLAQDQKDDSADPGTLAVRAFQDAAPHQFLFPSTGSIAEIRPSRGG